jgi:threonine dehydrogenase-like Zn-dependent dehydrogenase
VSALEQRGTMSAARLNLDTLEFGLYEVPIPAAEPGWVRVRVRSSGVCLTDVHMIRGEMKGPQLKTGWVTLGHEIAGEVDLVGAGVSGWDIGDRVAVASVDERDNGMHALGLDFDGGWAEWVVVPASMLVRIPDTLPFDIAAIIPDAVSTPWSAITATAEVRVGEAVALWGAGGLGAHAVQILRLIGAAPIIVVDPLPEARQRALRLGADFTVDPFNEAASSRVKELTDGRGVAVAFDFVGSSAVEATLLEALAPHGRAIFVGVNGEPFILPNPNRLISQYHQIRGHFANGPTAIPDLLRLLALDRLDFSESIGGTFALDAVAEAIDALVSKVGNPIRLVLNP